MREIGHMSYSSSRPHIQKRINELERIAYSNWDNPSVLFEVFVEIDHRRSRKRQVAFKDKILQRILFLASQYFKWPSTLAPTGDGNLNTANSPKRGLLSYLGYHVGRRGLSTVERREMLDRVYMRRVPTVNNPIYMADWGEPHSALRLKKTTEPLASFCRSQKRKSAVHVQSAAVADYESDLA
jgi:hypothetical protein